MRVPGLRRFPDFRSVLRNLAIILVAIVAIVPVFSVSSIGYLQAADAQAAVMRAPWDAQANANMSALLRTVGRTAEAQTLARTALSRDPISVVALRTLALVADEEGRTPQARQLIARTQQLSRRDQPTQLWLISHYLEATEFDAAIRNFDIALRTSRRSWDRLLPLLAAATADSRILPPLGRQLDEESDWKIGLFQTLATHGPRADHVVALLQGRLDPAEPQQRLVIERLLRRLVQEREFQLAWQLHRAVSPESWTGRDLVRNGGFEAAPRFAPFDWTMAMEADLAALPQDRPDAAPGKALGLIAHNNRAGEAARQLLRLAPGRYRLEAEMGAVPDNPFERPVLNVTCAEVPDAAPLAMLRPEASGEAPQRVGGPIVVPAQCGWLWLSIRINGGDGPAHEDNPWIDNVRIVRTS